MGLAEYERKKDEKINDLIYHMSPSPSYKHGIINNNINRKHLKGGTYSGVPRFIAETLSPSTAKRDRTNKKDIYETAGEEEYWIVSPQGAVEIYFLENGKYVLNQSYLLQNDKEDEEYNAEQEICLKSFPNIKMTLGEIFAGLE